MLASSIPTKFSFAWAYGAVSPYIRSIPQTTATPGAASLQFGYPPITFTPTGSGGIPPDGQDENGILNQITLWLQWMAAGACIPYDGTFQTAIGGYPNRALIASAVTAGLVWRSTADNNTTNPDTGGAGWVAWPNFQTAGNATQIWVGTDVNFVPTAASIAAASAQQTLTDAAPVAWNWALGYDAAITLTSAVGGTRVLGAPTNIVPGRTGLLSAKQPASGGPCTFTYNAIFDFGGAGTPTLSTGAGARDAFFFQHDPLSSKLITTFWKGS